MKRLFLVLVILMLAVSAFAEYTGPAYLKAQQQDVVTEVRAIAVQMIELQKRVDAIVPQWQVYGQTATQIFATDVLLGSVHAGLDPQSFSDTIGSLAAFQSYMGTHAVNFRKIK